MLVSSLPTITERNLGWFAILTRLAKAISVVMVKWRFCVSTRVTNSWLDLSELFENVAGIGCLAAVYMHSDFLCQRYDVKTDTSHLYRSTRLRVLGPVLFISYTPDVTLIFDSHQVNHHLYADDKQAYMSVPVNNLPLSASNTRTMYQ